MMITPQVYLWNGKRIDEMTRDELMASLIEAGTLLEAMREADLARRRAFSREILKLPQEVFS